MRLNVDQDIRGLTTVAVIFGVAFGAWWIYSKRAAISNVVTKKLNPASRDNLIYQATGEVGFKIADLFKSDAEKAVDKMMKNSWEMY